MYSVRSNKGPVKCEEHIGSMRESYALLSDMLKEEEEQRKMAEQHCRTLLQELEAREQQLQDLKNILFHRVSEAEDRMSKLVRLRDEETAKASRATGRLRDSISKLQQRFEDEKRQLKETLKTMQANSDEQIGELQESLKESESSRESLAAKLRKSEANANKLSEELVRMKTELSQVTTRLSQLTQTNTELSSNLTKVKLAYQKASGRAETAAKQLGELRKQAEQATSTHAEIERNVRTANERRIAAESALSAVRQRADGLQTRLSQLERELATEKARSGEKAQTVETELGKLRRRFLAVQSEAAKWKRAWQTEREERNGQIEQTNQAISSIMEQRSKLEVQLKEAVEREKDKLLQIEQLQREAAMEATNASSRLLVALSTSEEGVSAALELKRCIEEKLQPELDATKKRCERAEAEAQEWRQKYNMLTSDMERCQTAAKQLDQRLTEKQASVEKELTELRQQLFKVEEEARLKDMLLSKAEKQASAYEADLCQLKQAQQNLRESTDLELNKLTKESTELRVAHESLTDRLRLSQRLISKLRAARDTALTGLARAQVELQETKAAHESAGAQRANEMNNMKKALRDAQQKLQNLDTELHQAREEASQQLLRTNEAHERAIERLNYHLHEESHKARSMDHLQEWISELRKQVVSAETGTQAADEARTVIEQRLTESERTVQQLQQALTERDRQLEQLQAQLDERSKLVETRSKELDSLKLALDERLALVRKEADAARTQRAEALMEKQSLERRLREAEKTIAEYDQERSQVRARMIEMDKELRGFRQGQTNENKLHNQALGQLREELTNQLKEMQSQRDRTAECLRDANNFLVEQTANKQMLLERLKESQEQNAQTTSKLREELDQCQREKVTLQQQADDLRVRLSRADGWVREAEARCAQAELEHRRTARQVEKLALESASKRAVSQANASLHLDRDSPKPMSSSRLSRGATVRLPMDTGPLVRSNSCELMFSDRLSPMHSPSMSGSTAELELALSPWDSSHERKVTFASAPLMDSAANARPSVPEPCSTAADLEALIREVTMNLDKETGVTHA